MKTTYIFLILIFFSACSENEFTYETTFSSGSAASISHIENAHTVTFEFSKEVQLKSQALSSGDQLEILGDAQFDEYRLEVKGSKVLVHIDGFTKPGKLKIKLKEGVIVDKFGLDVELQESHEVDVYSPYFADQCTYQYSKPFYYENQLHFFCKPLYEDTSVDVKSLIWTYSKGLHAIQPTKHFKNIPTTHNISTLGDSTFLAENGGFIAINVREHKPLPEDIDYNNFDFDAFYASLESYKALYDLSTQEIHTFDSGISLYSYQYAKIGNFIYLAGIYPGVSGVQLLKINIQSKAISLAATINSSSSSQIMDLGVYGGKLVFSAVDGIDPERQLWTYDPSTEVAQIFVQQLTLDGTKADQFVMVNDKLYFTARYGSSKKYTLDVYNDADNTTSSTPLDINPHGGFSWKPHKVFSFENKIYYVAYVGTANQNDGNPTSYGFLEYDPATSQQRDLIPRENLIGEGPYTINHYSNNIYDIMVDEKNKRISWIQYSHVEQKNLLITFDVVSGEYSTMNVALVHEDNENLSRLNHNVSRGEAGMHLVVDHKKYGRGVSHWERMAQ